MLHIGKYFGYILRGGAKILFYPLVGRKYIKNKGSYSLQERYNFVKIRAQNVLDKVLKIKLDVKGLENLNKDETYLFVPNHQGMLDPVCLMTLFEEPAIFVSKIETKKYPVIGKINYMMDAIFLDRDSPRDALNMVRECKAHLLDNRDVVIFPEGTRSKDEEVSIHSYKPGAFKCAYGTNAKIVPIVIDKAYLPLSIKRKNTDRVIKLRFLKPIDKEEYEKMTTSELAEKIENIAKDELNSIRDEDKK